MLKFDEEIKKYSPLPEVGEVEDLVRQKDLTDMTDIMKAMIKESREQEGYYQ